MLEAQQQWVQTCMTKPMWRFRCLEAGCPLKVMVPTRFMCLKGMNNT